MYVTAITLFNHTFTINMATTATKRKHGPDDESSDEEESQRGYISDDEGGVRVDDIYIPPPPRPPGTIDTSGPRIIITKIVNTNFKSYGEEQILGPFHKNFNAIVGPNGSGKSNVIDSLLFVFGYRASKIRSKKLSVLLHKSEKFPNVQSCTVAVHFTVINDKDDPDEFDEEPDSKIIVSRTVHKDNTSYYQLNGVRVQYKEIALCLRKHGIDLDHNRFLILQGEVEQISLMKPKAQTEHDTGMLEYLEDIIGTTRFKEPLKKIDERIEVLSEMRTEKLNRVRLAEKEKDDLQEPMMEAVRFLELENTISQKRNFLYQRKIKRFTEKLTESEGKKSEFLNNEKEIKESIKRVQGEKKEREEKFSEQAKKYEILKKRKEDLKDAFDKANKKDINIQAEMTETNKRRKKVNELIHGEKSKLEDFKKLPQRNKETIDEYEKREQQLITEQETLETDKTKLLASLRQETLVLQEKKEEVQTELVGLRKIVDETKSAFTIAEEELKIYVSAEENERQKLSRIKTSLEENNTRLNERQKELKEAQKQVPATEKSYKDAVTQLERIKIEEAKVISEIKVKRVLLEETRSSMQASKSRGRVLDSLTQQKAEGNLPGLYGRLGDLGAIDQKYDVAVSTACGPLDHIVVDSVDTAQWCIEFLKQHNIGRASFIALDKQEHLRAQANSRINTPENVPRLYDLIKVEDDRVRTAFYFSLRDTLVAKDIDQATRIGYGSKRYRVVTLQGDLIEISGTMSGGGRTVSRGRMGQCVAVQSNALSPKKMHDMEDYVTNLERKAKDLHGTQIELEDEVSKLHAELRTLRTNVEKCTIELQSLQQQQPNLMAQLKKQEQKTKEIRANPAQVKKLQATVSAKKAEFEEASTKSEQLQKSVNTINQEIKERTDKKMRPITKRLKECTDMLEKCKAELVKLKVAIKTADRNSKKCADKISNLELEKTDAENRLKAMAEERKEIEKDAGKLLEIMQKVTEELAGGEDDFAEEQEIITSLNEKLKNFKSDKIEIDQQISEINKQLKECSAIMNHCKAKLAQLQLQEIPEKPAEELRTFTDKELEETDTSNMEVDLKREEEEMKKARPNVTAISEFKKKASHYIQRVNELEEASRRRTQMKELREDLRQKRQTEFHAGFKIISTKLKEMYQLITLGGDAELELVDSYDPFAEGVILNVRPPKKSWKNITNLSGGEKTLSSLALVFALHYYKPSPLYFMDEIDAALDFKNVSIVGNYIKERTKNAQFIIISLRSNMFELADHLIGIFKTYNVTKSITVYPRQYIKEPPTNNIAVASQIIARPNEMN